MSRIILILCLLASCYACQIDWTCDQCLSNLCIFVKTKTGFVCVKNINQAGKIRYIYESKEECPVYKSELTITKRTTTKPRVTVTHKIRTTTAKTPTTTTYKPATRAPRTFKTTTTATTPKTTSTTTAATVATSTTTSITRVTTGATTPKTASTTTTAATLATTTATKSIPRVTTGATTRNTASTLTLAIENVQSDQNVTFPLKITESGIFYDAEMLIPLSGHSTSFATKFIRTLCRVSRELEFYIRRSKACPLPLQEMFQHNPMSTRREICADILAAAKRQRRQ